MYSNIAPTKANLIRAKSMLAFSIRGYELLDRKRNVLMRDMMGMMKQAKELQAKMKAMQDEIADLEATASSGGGLVTVTLSGKGTLSSLKIDPSMMKEEDTEILEDLIIAAHNDAKAKLEAEMAEKTQSLTAGLPIPPGFKLPF